MAEASSSSAAAVPPLDPEAIAAVAEAAPPEEMTLVAKWKGNDYTVRVVGDDTLGELKRRICEVTGVLPKRQKLLYPKFKLNECKDSELISSIPFKPNVKINMIGTVEDEIFVDQEDDPEILNDYEIGQNEVTAIKDKDVYKQKLKRRASQYKIKILNPCRKGKKLLVLDIDYTLFDHRSAAENPIELMRPYLHEFLSAAYSEYDIMIWSATSMKWVGMKMDQLGVLGNPNYKITALMDHLAMITVQSENLSEKKTFDCKPLGVIWAQFPEYNETNTIMFDDLRRNFVMNPQNGLVIKPYKRTHSNRGTDQELVKLTQYLLTIAELEDLSKLDHSAWESFTEENAKRRRHR
ncbi:CTD-like phosphatase domain-containing protein-like [Oryza sativa Japonica Group]|uniref:protein-serine/threonine phosphatase n=3 Tax=Oryza sativa TaxID=4530 RepID=Q7F4K4_ORYSJ|nr:ubiquitin-like domain-containing CTD phosphatase [Oryza sativa Japonica Group]KAB8084545.1 hypothetical protein EE612_007127 [Oryza sativa]EAZ14344.1 hypothetical protein OsJ_04266 [Oryza sativa Japonica Group]KAF2953591.1 hypothetical protein DAI22_01g418600 [Oryza sativa Japonica Group]BAB86231.1 P0648C09.20 [Oryza sativa Japonica Group]BAB92447.1 CTD-like phosphatase domain-containing protein-like [Oryza sativa Japonica Group]|eukprot:NP_001044963.1 Os01g0875400 [Oryza sativa Japonica Group]